MLHFFPSCEATSVFKQAESPTVKPQRFITTIHISGSLIYEMNII